ncbi:hypothetical protein NJC38_08505 [Pseudomonas sp. 21LCFQ010]|uniref:hypothetical protein n=1 Tax=Pseudomonas sp. 21LCFQ010 TaxID=2957506 RepID=UPI002096C5C2|nr:hypothetical protein [Pseudomonas sp. 21LCFQ010]MCO8162200.1 hypothetical protein [Pseudomonas sp. 21LCFQ010]
MIAENQMCPLISTVILERTQPAVSLSGALDAWQNRLGNTAFLMSQTHNSVSALQAQWRKRSHTINQSASEIKTINSTPAPFDLAHYLSSVLTPWRRIKNILSQLLNTYLHALEQVDRRRERRTY